jgi:hypothetical protein
MDDDELETTMRHGLRELANDAPRGERLWDTTTSMIAIQPIAPPSPEPEPAPKKSRLGLVILLIALFVLALVAAVLIGIAVGSSSKSSPRSTPTTAPAPRPVGNWPAQAIPTTDFVFNDVLSDHVVVADGSLQPLGYVPIDATGNWRALAVGADRSQLFLVRTDTPCHELYDFDLSAQSLTKVIPGADVVALSPDDTKSVITWSAGCAAVANQPVNAVVLRDATAGTITPLTEISGGSSVNVTWSPDGNELAAEPVGSHHVFVYDSGGKLAAQFTHLASSQDALGWTTKGLVLVDLGNDRTAVLRTYDPANPTSQTVLGRAPLIPNGTGGPLVTPTVTAIHEINGRIFVEVEAGPLANAVVQLREISNGQVPLVAGNWYRRAIVG